MTPSRARRNCALLLRARPAGFGSPAILRIGCRLGGPPRKSSACPWERLHSLFGAVRHREQKKRITNMRDRTTLTGYLGKDAVLRTARNQTPFSVLPLGTHRFWKE